MLNIYTAVNETAKTSVTACLQQLASCQQKASIQHDIYSVLYKELHDIVSDYLETASMICSNVTNNQQASLYASWLNASADARNKLLIDYSQLHKQPQNYNACLTVTAGLLVMGKLKKLYDDNPSTFNYSIRTDAINYIKCLKLFGGIVALSSKDIQLAVADFKARINTVFSDFIAFAGIDDSEQTDSIKDRFRFDEIAWAVFRDVIPIILDYEKNYCVSDIGADIVAETKLNLLAYLKYRDENIVEINDCLVSIISYDSTSFLDDNIYYFLTTKHNAIDNTNLSDEYLTSYDKYACYYGSNSQLAGIKTTTAGKFIFSCIDSYLNKHKKELNNKADNVSHVLTASEQLAFVEICKRIGYTVAIEQYNGIQQAVCCSEASKDIQAVNILYYTCCNFGIASIADKLELNIGNVYLRLNSLKARLYKVYNKSTYNVSIDGSCIADKNNRLVCSNIHIVDKQAEAKRQQASCLLFGYCRTNSTGVYGIAKHEQLATNQIDNFSAVKQLFDRNHEQLLNKLAIQDEQQQSVLKSLTRHKKKLIKQQVKKYQACIKNTCVSSVVDKQASELYFTARQQAIASQQALQQAVNKKVFYDCKNVLNSKPKDINKLTVSQLLANSKPAIKQLYSKPAVNNFYTSKQSALSRIQAYNDEVDIAGEYLARQQARQHRRQAYKAIKQRYSKPAVDSFYTSKQSALSIIQPATPYIAMVDDETIRQFTNGWRTRQRDMIEQYYEQQQAFKLAYVEKYGKQA